MRSCSPPSSGSAPCPRHSSRPCRRPIRRRRVRAAVAAPAAVRAAAAAVAAAAVAAAAASGRDRFGLGWRPELAAGILANLDRIEVVEIVAEEYLAASRRQLRAV